MDSWPWVLPVAVLCLASTSSSSSVLTRGTISSILVPLLRRIQSAMLCSESRFIHPLKIGRIKMDSVRTADSFNAYDRMQRH
ncbi:unnamed protein product [Albugo candida]|uniref:RxLR effector protein n=1 Tax=Albugo candida TaxID=65357 RepID=A0A024GN43_9STRA|nr:unnamed protein product [Albugo candida]|eukprot:CCI48208.1 unnamed protein product [Albugo candida]